MEGGIPVANVCIRGLNVTGHNRCRDLLDPQGVGFGFAVRKPVLACRHIGCIGYIVQDLNSNLDYRVFLACGSRDGELTGADTGSTGLTQVFPSRTVISRDADMGKGTAALQGQGKAFQAVQCIGAVIQAAAVDTLILSKAAVFIGNIHNAFGLTVVLVLPNFPAVGNKDNTVVCNGLGGITRTGDFEGIDRLLRFVRLVR